MQRKANPVRLIPLLFLAAIAIGTILLMLPVATETSVPADFVTALFTSTSAVAVTGLIVEDTATYWSPFGKIIILALFQIGGFGIMTAATLLGLAAGRGVSLSTKMATKVERSRLDIGNGASVLKLVLAITVVVEAAVAVILALRFRLSYDFSWGEAVWHGVFHSISAFNNAGFSSFSDSVMGFQMDAVILLPIMVAVVITALGFPVMQELRALPFSPRRWTLHSKITVAGTVILLAVGFVAILLAEWSNAKTLGPMGVSGKMLNAAFHSVMPRTAGFNSLDVGMFTDISLTTNYLLMFIGGGSAGTAGGVKITTFALLLAIVWSDIRGHQDPSMFGRRFGHGMERQAVTVAFLAIAMIAIGTLIIMAMTDIPMHRVLFETISAFATVGLSTGITADLPDPAHIVLVVLMYVGRVGTITAATALALGAGRKPFRYPEENPIVG
ncbi:MAG: potassium transporter TrkG [Pontixanthobacter sp.]